MFKYLVSDNTHAEETREKFHLRHCVLCSCDLILQTVVLSSLYCFVVGICDLPGACWNKIPPQHSYHSFEKSREYVQKYFKVIRNGIISTYGHIPLVPLPPPPSTNTAESTVSPTPSSTVAAGASSASAPALAPGTVTCRLRATKTDLTLDSIEEEFISAFCKLMEEYFDIETLLFDLNKYYAKLVKLVSVV